MCQVPTGSVWCEMHQRDLVVDEREGTESCGCVVRDVREPLEVDPGGLRFLECAVGVRVHRHVPVVGHGGEQQPSGAEVLQ